MPSKAKKEVNTPDDQFNRRRSARLAGLDKDKSTESPKMTKKEPAKKKSRKTVSDKMSKGDVELDSSAELKNHTDKKLDISKDEEESKTTDTKESAEMEEQKIDETDFVIVKKSDVPSPDSKEVKQALPAQGEDASAGVKAAVPTAAINGVCTANDLESVKMDEPQQQAGEAKISSV